MNIRRRIVIAALLSTATGVASAQEALQSMPAVQAKAAFHVADCARRVLPSQREVGEWTGQHNFSQVYDSRDRLMGELARACKQPGVAQVRLVLDRRGADSDPRWLASIEPAAR